jgi:hypothetical protein
MLFTVNGFAPVLENVAPAVALLPTATPPTLIAFGVATKVALADTPVPLTGTLNVPWLGCDVQQAAFRCAHGRLERHRQRHGLTLSERDRQGRRGEPAVKSAPVVLIAVTVTEDFTVRVDDCPMVVAGKFTDGLVTDVWAGDPNPSTCPSRVPT